MHSFYQFVVDAEALVKSQTLKGFNKELARQSNKAEAVQRYQVLPRQQVVEDEYSQFKSPLYYGAGVEFLSHNYFDFFRRSSEQWALDELKVSEQKVYTKENEISLIAKDLDIANKELSEQSANIDLIKGELKASEQKMAELKEQHEQLHAHSKWLQNEWDASKIKIDELNASSHHWWLESERISKELHTVYRSKSWKITWPFRMLMRFVKWLFLIPTQLIIWVFRLPKRIIRWLLVKAMAFVLKRPTLKLKTMNWLRSYPSFTAKLKRLAQARGLVAAPVVNRESIEPKEGKSLELEALPAEPLITTPKPDLSNLTPTARKIYEELKLRAQ